MFVKNYYLVKMLKPEIKIEPEFEPNDVITSPVGNKYTIQRHLGGGAFGDVYLVTSPAYPQPIALKTINLDEYPESFFITEMMAYTYLSISPDCNQNIVCLLDVFEIDVLDEDSQQMIPFGILVIDLQTGDLEHNQVADENIPDLILALLTGLSAIHGAGLAHRDIKPDNILFRDKIYKYGDLGEVCTHRSKDLEVEIETPSGPKKIFRGNDEIRFSLIPTCDEVLSDSADFPGTNPEAEDIYYEQAKSNDIAALGYTLYNVIYGKPYISKTKLGPYPRKEPDQLSGPAIVELINRMISGSTDVNQLLKFYQSNLRVTA